MKFMKKIMAAVAASAVAVLSFASLTASADLKARDEAPYNAFLAIQAGGDSKWVSSTDDPAVVAQKFYYRSNGSNNYRRRQLFCRCYHGERFGNH